VITHNQQLTRAIQLNKLLPWPVFGVSSREKEVTVMMNRYQSTREDRQFPAVI
jgi:hypothetical protein